MRGPKAHYNSNPEQARNIDEDAFTARVSVGGLRGVLLRRKLRRAERASKELRARETMTGAYRGVRESSIGGVPGFLADLKGTLVPVPLPDRLLNRWLGKRAIAKAGTPGGVAGAFQRVVKAERPLQRLYGSPSLPRVPEKPKVPPTAVVHLDNTYWKKVDLQHRLRDAARANAARTETAAQLMRVETGQARHDEMLAHLKAVTDAANKAATATEQLLRMANDAAHQAQGAPPEDNQPGGSRSQQADETGGQAPHPYATVVKESDAPQRANVTRPLPGYWPPNEPIEGEFREV